MTRHALVLLLLLPPAPSQTAAYELRGRLVPAARASISLHGTTSPFESNTLAGDDGRFRFRDLAPGAYTLGAFVPGRGEIRRTIEVGPSQARAGNRIELSFELRDADFETRDSLRQAAMVSAKDLAIPDQARREYEEAGRKLARRDAEAAVAHLQRAVGLAPQFAEAWNHLGTIAYQSRDFPRAENCFRRALAADPNLFQPLVNLGGVLINLRKFDEALQYNLHATLSHPNDALANSQLGMSYFFLDRLDLAQKYLGAAKQLDPAHFSHPQLVLAQIHMRRRDPAAAAAELEDFLQQHPDSPDREKVRDRIGRLRNPPDPAAGFADTAMARSFVDTPEAVSIGSGRHFRQPLTRGPNGLAASPDHPGFGFSAGCLACHASGTSDRPQPMNCSACHGNNLAASPPPSACLTCHPSTSGPDSAHRATPAADEKLELNSAGYRLLASRCYQASAAKLTCTTCHPPHTFSKAADEFRAVCRNCHPTQHNRAALDCVRCHMPKRLAADAPEITVTDHRIQRPL